MYIWRLQRSNPRDEAFLRREITTGSNTQVAKKNPWLLGMFSWEKWDVKNRDYRKMEGKKIMYVS